MLKVGEVEMGMEVGEEERWAWRLIWIRRGGRSEGRGFVDRGRGMVERVQRRIEGVVLGGLRGLLMVLEEVGFRLGWARRTGSSLNKLT